MEESKNLFTFPVIVVRVQHQSALHVTASRSLGIRQVLNAA